MPFQSKAQMAKMAELEKQGKVKKGTVKQWASETPDIKKLPERKSPKKVASIADLRKLSSRFGIK